MRMIDLFTGIGGFHLAAESVWGDDLEVLCHCEIDPYCQAVLKKHWPEIPIIKDVKKFDSNKFSNVDLITGGFPCQDISYAGKGEGLNGERSGLWFEFYRIICELRPKFAIIENVPAVINRGLETILSNLAAIRYDAEWQIISAAEVGAWHKRDRTWIIAYPQVDASYTDADCVGLYRAKEYKQNSVDREIKLQDKQKCEPEQICEYVSDSNIQQLDDSGRRTGQISRQSWAEKKTEVFTDRWWSAEPNVGRVAHGVPDRVDRLKSLGNAIVPQVAAIIMKAIKDETDRSAKENH